MNTKLASTILLATHLGTGFGVYSGISALNTPPKPTAIVIDKPIDQPVPDAPPVATYAVVEPHVETTEEIIKRYFGDESRLATAVFKAESGLRQDAIGDTNTPYHSVGVAQIRLLPSRGITKDDMLDQEHNIEYAKYLRDKSGWQNWTAYRNGKYKKYLH